MPNKFNTNALSYAHSFTHSTHHTYLVLHEVELQLGELPKMICRESLQVAFISVLIVCQYRNTTIISHPIDGQAFPSPRYDSSLTRGFPGFSEDRHFQIISLVSLVFEQ